MLGDVVHIGLGSNLGDRQRNLDEAVEALSRIDAAQVLRRSSLFDTAPIGPDQPRYLNAVVELSCALEPAALLSILQEIERDAGRERTERWGPRTLDLDVLLWGTRIVAEPRLQIPHLGLHQRRFVLEPLVELVPDAVHPVLGGTLRALLAELPPQDVTRLDSPRWRPEPPTAAARSGRAQTP